MEAGKMIYFIITADEKYVKIGYTRSQETLAARLESLQSGNPQRLQYLATISGGGLKMERDLHERFAEFRAVGEWFEYSPPVQDFITTYGRRLIKSNIDHAEFIELLKNLNSTPKQTRKFWALIKNQITDTAQIVKQTQLQERTVNFVFEYFDLL